MWEAIKRLTWKPRMPLLPFFNGSMLTKCSSCNRLFVDKGTFANWTSDIDNHSPPTLATVRGQLDLANLPKGEGCSL